MELDELGPVALVLLQLSVERDPVVGLPLPPKGSELARGVTALLLLHEVPLINVINVHLLLIEAVEMMVVGCEDLGIEDPQPGLSEH